ncbi:MAG: CPBP family intramembrane metalloprotease [Pseudobutyrivibrio sp.]|nr:CPBP family intramembrane metalloprotease [Pseudobutyrivibrio sp.]
MTSKKAYSRIGLILTISIALDLGLVYLLKYLGNVIWPDGSPSLFTYLVSFLIMDGVVLPFIIFAVGKLPAMEPAKTKLSVGNWIIYVLMTYGLAIAGNIVIVIISLVLKLITGHGEINPLMDLFDNEDVLVRVLSYLFACVIAPIMEELSFRKMLVSRMLPYGEKAAIITSGIMFGLFHGNINQAFYATIMGMMLANLYVRTGKIKYTIFMHMFINSIAALLTIFMQIHMLFAGMFSMIVYMMAFAGIALFFIYRKKIFYINHTDHDTKVIDAWLNVGMILFLIAVVGEIACSFYFA